MCWPSTGLPTADEMLYPDNYRYLSDLLSYVAVGARSVENQEHRLTSSGIDIPVGMKNPTSGDISVMLNSIMAAQHPHTFIYRGWEVDTTGNSLAHAILRGYVNKHGESMPNYHFEELERLYNAYTAKGLQNMALIVDANHANSGKKYQEQPRICKEVLHSCRHSGEIKSMVKGFMVESYCRARLPEDRRRRLRQIHHRPLSRLGGNNSLGSGYCGFDLNVLYWVLSSLKTE